MGIPPGARVGSIGTGLSAYWAHLAGVQIIAEVPERDQTSFSSADPARKEEALRKFDGALMMVSHDPTFVKAVGIEQELSVERSRQ